MEKLLEQYHPILLSKEDVKAIFRLVYDRSFRYLKNESDLRKRGRYYLAKYVREAIQEMESEQAA